MAINKEAIINRLQDTSEEDDFELVSFYVDNAEEIVLNQLYPFDEAWNGEEPVTVPARYTNLVTRIALYLIQKAGIDGETLHVENGMHRHYGSADVSPELLRQITPKASVF